ncbi:MAG: mechanosensitive ion channel family protein [Deltaproteobacteria bacterium]|nr:mechanosensitive ion channel family protein [Deltaproteobacteria bacterium]
MSAVVVVVVAAALLGAGGAADPAPCATPRQAAATILGNLNGANPDVRRALRCIEVPRDMSATTLAARLATLQDALDSAGVVVRPQDIPDDPQHLDERSFLPEFVLTPSLPRVRLVKDDHGDWKLPGDVVRDADVIRSEVVAFDLLRMSKTLGPAWHARALGIELWQAAGFAAVVAVAVLLRLLLAVVLLRKLMVLLTAMGVRHEREELKAAARPVGWLLGCAVVAVFAPTLAFPATLTALVLGATRLTAALSVVWLAVRLVDVTARHFAARAQSTNTRMDDHLVPMLSRMAKVVVMVVGAVLGLQVIGVDVGSLVAGLGIGGLAVALAAKDTIGNFFGSIAIFLDRPFQIGDWVILNHGTVEGTVENVGFRSTQIRTIRDTVISVPNAKLADAEVDNAGARRARRLRFLVSFTLDATPAQVEAFIAATRGALMRRECVKKTDVEVHLHELSADALQVLVHCYVVETTWTGELRTRHEVLMDIVQIAADVGLRLAFPTRTLHLPGDALPTPSSTELDALVAGWTQTKTTTTTTPAKPS